MSNAPWSSHHCKHKRVFEHLSLEISCRKIWDQHPSSAPSQVSEVPFHKAASGWNSSEFFWVEEGLEALLQKVPSRQTALRIPSPCAVTSDMSFTFLSGQWLLYSIVIAIKTLLPLLEVEEMTTTFHSSSQDTSLSPERLSDLLACFDLPVTRPNAQEAPSPLSPAGTGPSCLQSNFSPYSSQMEKISSYAAERSALGSPRENQLLCLPGSFLVVKGCCDRGARVLLLLVFPTAPP